LIVDEKGTRSVKDTLQGLGAHETSQNQTRDGKCVSPDHHPSKQNYSIRESCERLWIVERRARGARHEERAVGRARCRHDMHFDSNSEKYGEEHLRTSRLEVDCQSAALGKIAVTLRDERKGVRD